MTRLLQRLLDPAFRLWSPFFLLRAGIASSMLPKPTDAPVVHIPGADPDRLLVVGGGITVGFGVLSHELGIVGHLARQISGATGRGVEADLIAEADLRADEVPSRIRDSNLTAYDAILLFLGVTDAIRRTSTRAWRTALSSLIEDIDNRTAAGTRILVVGIQPVRLVTTLDNRFGLFAELHARSLDRESARVCAQWPQATFIPFHPRAELTERYRTSATYGKWAALVSPAVIEALQQNHPLGDFTI
ncbi:SGNH/GDSL hydrolase family protein [Homoserinimonas sp. A447]